MRGFVLFHPLCVDLGCDDPLSGLGDVLRWVIGFLISLKGQCSCTQAKSTWKPVGSSLIPKDAMEAVTNDRCCLPLILQTKVLKLLNRITLE